MLKFNPKKEVKAFQKEISHNAFLEVKAFKKVKSHNACLSQSVPESNLSDMHCETLLF